MIFSRSTLLLYIVSVLVLGACTTVTQQSQPQTSQPPSVAEQTPAPQPNQSSTQQTVIVQQSPPTPVVVRPQPIKITATGQGSMGSYGQHNAGQQKLMAIRAAKLDAYRNLAEQVYGFQISGSTTVNAFVSQNDSIRAYVEAFVRGARIVDITSSMDGIYEATVELELPHDFGDCIVRGTCFAPPGARVAGCVGPNCAPMAVVCTGVGCAQPSGRTSWWDALWHSGP